MSISVTEDSTPRGGSPFPNRREFPRSGYVPSRSMHSRIIRSISHEEAEEETDSETSHDIPHPRPVPRKTSLPAAFGACRGYSSEF